MTAPIPPRKRRLRPVDPEEAQRAELEQEAYGTSGRKLRKAAKAIGQSQGGAPSLGTRVAGRVKAFLKRTQGK